MDCIISSRRRYVTTSSRLGRAWLSFWGENMKLGKCVAVLVLSMAVISACGSSQSQPKAKDHRQDPCQQRDDYGNCDTSPDSQSQWDPIAEGRVRVEVSQDPAFNFYYPEDPYCVVDVLKEYFDTPSEFYEATASYNRDHLGRGSEELRKAVARTAQECPYSR
jgi:hypothetical protein